jgi:hypothetical protein
MSNAGRHLPVIQESDNDAETPSCSPKIYISNEEAALLAAMRGLRERSIAVKKQVEGADRDRRVRLEAELEELRSEWKVLSDRREQAFIRKMISLGHLPPDHPVER